MMSNAIGRLHVITDTVLQTQWSHAELAQMAGASGADVVQYRDKRQRDDATRASVARALRAELPDSVQVIVNDHVQVAREVGADGVHLGAADLPVHEARRMLGPSIRIGATANSLEEALRRFEEPIDYLGVGPVFGTTSKADPAPRMGLDVLARIVGESPVPVIAIGGIEPRDVEAVLQSGAHGIAVLSGVVCQPDPRAAVRCYRHALDSALLKWGTVTAKEEEA